MKAVIVVGLNCCLLGAQISVISPEQPRGKVFILFLKSSWIFTVGSNRSKKVRIFHFSGAIRGKCEGKIPFFDGF
ncbi:MAG: hypothetical protein SFV22_10270 [Saprospiraceae bacterium]|nr:hypothetical protein [Saprospiraceae bacterium]